MGIVKIKMLLVKKYSGEKAKFKGVLTQIKLKIQYKGAKLSIVIN